MSHKYVYLFTEGNGSMRELLGGKGANLAEMTNIGLPVPQGFTVTTEACTRYYEDGKTIGADIQAQIDEALEKIEKLNEKAASSRSTMPVKNPARLPPAVGARMKRRAIASVRARSTMKHTAHASESMI